MSSSSNPSWPAQAQTQAQGQTQGNSGASDYHGSSRRDLGYTGYSPGSGGGGGGAGNGIRNPSGYPPSANGAGGGDLPRSISSSSSRRYGGHHVEDDDGHPHPHHHPSTGLAPAPAATHPHSHPQSTYYHVNELNRGYGIVHPGASSSSSTGGIKRKQQSHRDEEVDMMMMDDQDEDDDEDEEDGTGSMDLGGGSSRGGGGGDAGAEGKRNREGSARGRYLMTVDKDEAEYRAGKKSIGGGGHSSNHGNNRNDDDNGDVTGTGSGGNVSSSRTKERPGRGKGMRRGARACTNCRRGKNRCEGDHPCRRCATQGLDCVFVKPTPKAARANNEAGGSMTNVGSRIGANGGGGGGGDTGNHSSSMGGPGPDTHQLRMAGLAGLNGMGGINGMAMNGLATLAQMTNLNSTWNNGALGDPEGRFMNIESSVNHLAASQNQMQSTLSQILSALSQNQMNNQMQTPAAPHLNYPQPSPPQHNLNHNNGLPLHNARTMGNSNMFDLNGLAPPDATRLDPFSPGTVAALTEVAVASGYGDPAHVLVPEPANQMDATTYSPSVGTSAGGLKNGSGSRHGSMNGRRDEDGFAWPDPPKPKPGGTGVIRMHQDIGEEEDVKPKEFPKLPGFKPPPHRFANYGLVVSSTTASSDDESEDTLPRSSLNAPIEALHQLANAADQAAKENAQMEAENRRQGFLSPPRVLQNQLRFKRMKKPDPAPRNAFPDVITKGLVSQEEAKELWNIFFSGCHYFIPVFDPSYDEFESFVQRTPFSFDGMLAVAAKIRAGTGPLGRTHAICLEEAQGIARSTLFGPVVRKEAVMAVLILASWSQDPWLPSGHALRMGLDMNLHKALEKLAEESGTFGGGKARTDAEERDLVVSARIWLNCYLNDHTVSLGTGRPLMLRDDESVRNARQLLSHPMTSETDVRLVACVELMSHKVRVWTHLHPLRGRIDTTTIDFVRRVSNDLVAWHAEWRTRHLQKQAEDSVLVKLLDAELYYAQLWTACVALRGCNWEKLSLDQRELAFQAKEAALSCLAAYKSSSLRHYLKYAVHETMVQASFAAVFLLKIAILFPTQVTPKFISQEVSDLANLMSECAAERYALTLRLMLRSFRRKMGETTMAPGTPRNGHVAGNSIDGMIPGHRGLESLLSLDGNPSADFSLDDLGPFNWPEDGFSPSNLPQWITEGNVMDLGLPYDGSDSIFLPPELANMFLPAPTTWQLPDSADAGAEAW